MRDDGQGGDARAGDRVFTATVPVPADATVRYYVEAATAAGRVVLAPSSGGVRAATGTAPGAVGDAAANPDGGKGKKDKKRAKDR